MEETQRCCWDCPLCRPRKARVRTWRTTVGKHLRFGKGNYSQGTRKRGYRRYDEDVLSHVFTRPKQAEWAQIQPGPVRRTRIGFRVVYLAWPAFFFCDLAWPALVFPGHCPTRWSRMHPLFFSFPFFWKGPGCILDGDTNLISLPPCLASLYIKGCEDAKAPQPDGLIPPLIYPKYSS
jgi:hypothetical protein